MKAEAARLTVGSKNAPVFGTLYWPDYCVTERSSVRSFVVRDLLLYLHISTYMDTARANLAMTDATCTEFNMQHACGATENGSCVYLEAMRAVSKAESNARSYLEGTASSQSVRECEGAQRADVIASTI